MIATRLHDSTSPSWPSSSRSRCSGVLLALRYLPVARTPPGVGRGRPPRCGWRCSNRASTRVVSGLAVGLVTSAYPPARDDLERATELARSFREQPTAGARAVGAAGRSPRRSRPTSACSTELHPWTSYVIVPLFALANAGVHITGGAARQARSPRRSRSGSSSATSSASRSASLLAILARHAPAAAWSAPADQPTDALFAAGTCAGHRLHGLAADLDASPSRGDDSTRRSSARCHRRRSRRCSRGSALSIVRRCPTQVRARQIAAHRRRPPRPHRRRRPRARPHPRCRGRARDAARVRRLRVPVLRPGRARDPRTARSTRATTSATCGAISPSTTSTSVRADRPPKPPRRPAPRDSFWEMYDLLLGTPGRAPVLRDLMRHARELELDVERFPRRAPTPRRTPTASSPTMSPAPTRAGSPARPTFFINGRRHYGVYDLQTLTEAVKAAARRAGQLQAAPAAASR